MFPFRRASWKARNGTQAEIGAVGSDNDGRDVAIGRIARRTASPCILVNRVAAIVPTYNRRDYVGVCIRSLLNQSRKPDEIVVVDDGSTDGTYEFLEGTFAGRISLLRKENGGKSSALNFALERVESDYVWFCDDDDIAAPDGCENLLNALREAPSAIGFAYGHYRIFTKSPNGVLLFPPSFWAAPEEPNVRINILEDLHTFQFATLFRRAAIDRAGPFREDLHRSQDLDMMIRVTEQFDGTYVPRTIFYQRNHEGSRGPAVERAEARNSHERWLDYDRRFFPALIASDRSFCPSFAREWNVRDKERASLLQRAVVFGRRGYWRIALDNLEQASRLATGAARPPEQRQAARLIRHGLPSSAFPRDRALLRRFARLRRSSAFGHSIGLAIGEALVARIRRSVTERRWRDTRIELRLLLAIGGVSFMRRFLSGAVIARLRKSQRAPLAPPGPVDAEDPPHTVILPAERGYIAGVLRAERE